MTTAQPGNANLLIGPVAFPRMAAFGGYNPKRQRGDWTVRIPA
jgi:hypothetical protein